MRTAIKKQRKRISVKSNLILKGWMSIEEARKAASEKMELVDYSHCKAFKNKKDIVVYEPQKRRLRNNLNSPFLKPEIKSMFNKLIVNP